MFFTPTLKRKKGGSNKWLIKPFPQIELGKKCDGIFTGISVEVCGSEDIVAIYDSGFYGKGSLSRSTPQAVIQNSTSRKALKNVEESLSLGLEEAFFLAYYLEVLKIYDLDYNEMGFLKYLENCLKVNNFFVEFLASYLYLKCKGWVVKSGLKFGGNYLIYRRGPRFFHASFVVIISNPFNTDYLDSKNFKGLKRVAETSDKDVLVLEVHTPDGFQLVCLDTISRVEISEMVIKRFNYTNYVQSQK